MADFDLTSTPVVPSAEEPRVPSSFGEGIDLSSVPVGKVEVPPEKQTRWGEAAKSGLMRMGTGLVGMQGDIEQLAAQSPVLAQKAYAFGREKLGIPLSPEDLAAQEAGAQRISGHLQERQEKGPFAGIPGGERFYAPPVTSEEINKAIEPAAVKAFGVGPEMVPRTPQEAIVQGGLSMAGPNVMGPVKGVAKRLATGVAGGAGSEAAGEYAKGTAWEIPARIAGVIAGSKAAQPVLNAAETATKAVIPSSITGGPSMAAQEKLAGVLGDYGAESSATARRMSQAPGVQEATAGFPNRMRGFTQEITGVDAKAPAYQAHLEDLGKIERQKVYDAARATPAAQAIDDAPFAELRKRPIFQEAEKAAQKNAANLPDWDLRAPETVKGSPATPMLGANKQPMVDASGNPIMKAAVADVTTPGNLQHYDETKKQLDSIIEQAKRIGDPPRLAAAMDAKQELLNVLDPLIPEYKAARGIASDTFKAASAPEAGARFLTTHDMYDKKEFIDAFKSYNPAQQKAFGVGLMGQLEEDIIKNPKLIAQKFIKNPDMMEKLSLAFGPEKAQAIRGKALSENLLQQANQIREKIQAATQLQGAKSPIMAPMAGTVGAILGAPMAYMNYPVVSNFLTSLGVPQAGQLLAAGAAAAVGTGAYAMNKIEQRIANQMVNLAKSNDPRAFTRVANLMDEYPGVYNKVLGPLMVTNEEAQKQASQRPTRATGGAVNLMALSKAAKKRVTQSTEGLLDEDDSTVARALEVANQHI